MLAQIGKQIISGTNPLFCRALDNDARVGWLAQRVLKFPKCLTLTSIVRTNKDDNIVEGESDCIAIRKRYAFECDMGVDDGRILEGTAFPIGVVGCQIRSLVVGAVVMSRSVHSGDGRRDASALAWHTQVSEIVQPITTVARAVDQQQWLFGQPRAKMLICGEGDRRAGSNAGSHGELVVAWAEVTGSTPHSRLREVGGMSSGSRHRRLRSARLRPFPLLCSVTVSGAV